MNPSEAHRLQVGGIPYKKKAKGYQKHNVGLLTIAK